MRKAGELFYILGDHLGSTSLVTDADGTKVSEIRYRVASLWDKAWGEVRYESGATPTGYTYTGQYSYTADFGLMFYNARWYDPSLGRFAQADSMIASSQEYDRYSYVGNNSIRYTDPSGHCRIDADAEDCLKSNKSNAPTLPKALGKFGINASGLSIQQQKEALAAADNYGRFFYQEYGDKYGFTSSADAFKKVTGGNITIEIDTSRGNCETNIYVITCGTAAMVMKTFVHEFVHVMDNHYSVRSTNDEHCANATGNGCLASNYFPPEYFSDPQYAYMPYFYNDTRSISHPNTPGYGEYNTAEAYANYMENVILSGLGIDPANNGFKKNDFSNNLHTWRETGYGNIYQTLKVFGP